MTAATFDYDLFVIGGGSGGVRAARIAAGYGAKVAVAEEYRVGGTCVIRGCVPKKLMVYASRFGDEFEDARGFGWSVGETSFDWSTLIAAKDKEVARLEAIYGVNLEKAGVEIIKDRAEVEGPHELRLKASGRAVTAKVILVATGGWPSTDARFSGIEHTITSNEVFHLAEQPKRILIAGGGYIAVEFASIFAGLRTETTLIYRGDQILRGFDREVRDHVSNALQARGIRIITNEVIASLDKRAEGLAVKTTGGQEIVVDQVMLAIGRTPNTKGLGLERAGVSLKQNGAVIVNAQSQSNVPSIYAVGDVTDRVALTPVAIREGHAFADTVFGGNTVIADHSGIPTAVFTTPEIGTVGISEDIIKTLDCDYDVYRASFRPMKNILAGRDEKMLMKLLVEQPSDRVVGCHIVGPDAGEMAQLVAIAMKMKATKAQFDATMALHPSAAEELVTMRTPSERIRRSK
jgi:glutathione reductase (NADPH)